MIVPVFADQQDQSLCHFEGDRFSFGICTNAEANAKNSKDILNALNQSCLDRSDEKWSIQIVDSNPTPKTSEPVSVIVAFHCGEEKKFVSAKLYVRGLLHKNGGY